MDFSTFKTIETKKTKKVKSIEEVIQEAKNNDTYQYLITIKLSEAFGMRGKIRITVKGIKDDYTYATSTGTLKNKDTILKKFVKEYKKMGKIKIIDLTENDNNQ